MSFSLLFSFLFAASDCIVCVCDVLYWFRFFCFGIGTHRLMRVETRASWSRFLWLESHMRGCVCGGRVLLFLLFLFFHKISVVSQRSSVPLLFSTKRCSLTMYSQVVYGWFAFLYRRCWNAFSRAMLPSAVPVQGGRAIVRQRCRSLLVTARYPCQ